ncbi:hypothetical protein VcTj87_24600 [Vibrio comitans]
MGARSCPVAEEFISAGATEAQVPLSTKGKIGSMVLVEKDGRQYIIGIHGQPSYTKTKMDLAKEIFMQSQF